ncbi:MAG: DUF1816 domain-containing protein [Cyanobacteriota bacterium]|nr:DUF1816 domain-containing protein [Cyanobacteriota bacterium]
MALNESDASLESSLYLLEVIPGRRQSASRLLPADRNRYFLKVAYPQLSQTLQRLSQNGDRVIQVTPSSVLQPPATVAWWIEIYTDYPTCLYYFGPFESEAEAQSAEQGFIDDLREEGAEQVAAQIKQCRPQILTQEW